MRTKGTKGDLGWGEESSEVRGRSQKIDSSKVS